MRCTWKNGCAFIYLTVPWFLICKMIKFDYDNYRLWQMCCIPHTGLSQTQTHSLAKGPQDSVCSSLFTKVLLPFLSPWGSHQYYPPLICKVGSNLSTLDDNHRSTFYGTCYIIAKLVIPLQEVTCMDQNQRKACIMQLFYCLKTPLKTALASYIKLHKDGGHCNRMVPAL